MLSIRLCQTLFQPSFQNMLLQLINLVITPKAKTLQKVFRLKMNYNMPHSQCKDTRKSLWLKRWRDPLSLKPLVQYFDLIQNMNCGKKTTTSSFMGSEKKPVLCQKQTACLWERNPQQCILVVLCYSPLLNNQDQGQANI